MAHRILHWTLVAAWVAAAAAARAYDPSDPSGPPPDDPAAWSNQPAPRRVAQDLERCDMMYARDPALDADDPSAYRGNPDRQCVCEAMTTCAQEKSPPRRDGKAWRDDPAAADSPG